MSSRSSETEEEEVPSTGSNIWRTSPALVVGRSKPFLYVLHTYTAESNEVVDKSFVFRLDRAVNRQFTNQLFRSVYPEAPCLTDMRSRVSLHAKVMIMKGRHKNEAGVVVGRKGYSRVFKILVADTSMVMVHQKHFKFLDYNHFLPFGVPLPEWVM